MSVSVVAQANSDQQVDLINNAMSPNDSSVVDPSSLSNQFSAHFSAESFESALPLIDLAVHCTQEQYVTASELALQDRNRFVATALTRADEMVTASTTMTEDDKKTTRRIITIANFAYKTAISIYRSLASTIYACETGAMNESMGKMIVGSIRDSLSHASETLKEAAITLVEQFAKKTSERPGITDGQQQEAQNFLEEVQQAEGPVQVVNVLRKVSISEKEYLKTDAEPDSTLSNVIDVLINVIVVVAAVAIIRYSPLGMIGALLWKWWSSK